MKSKPTFIPKVILITGCSSGFGLLTAAHLSSKGHYVIATMRNLDKQLSLRNQVKKSEVTVDIKQMDVTDPASIKKTIAEIGARYGNIDVLINNAGYGLGGFFEDLTDEEIRQQMETNFFGVQHVTRAVIPLMRQRKNGRIISLSSVSGFSSSPAFGAYNASKWALEGFMESLRYELKFFGIKVLLIEPGTYKTKIFFENAKYAKNFNNEDSPYFPISQHIKKKVMDSVEDCFKDPEEIPILIEKLINAKNPPFRSIPDIETQLQHCLRKILPFRMYAWLVERILFTDLKFSGDYVDYPSLAKPETNESKKL